MKAGRLYIKIFFSFLFLLIVSEILIFGVFRVVSVNRFFNEIERQLVQIWQQVLERDNIGIHDDFFALGGHSILATKVQVRMREHMAIELPLKVLFEVTRIAELAELISSISKPLLENEMVDRADEDFEEGTL